MPTNPSTPQRVLVCGGRKYSDAETAERVLQRLDRSVVVVHGAAPGADRLAARLWRGLGGVDDPHPADWDGPCRSECKPGHRQPTKHGAGTYCPAAGNYRNQEMLESGVAYVIAFPGNRGTRDMCQRATDAGVKVVLIP